MSQSVTVRSIPLILITIFLAGVTYNSSKIEGHLGKMVPVEATTDSTSKSHDPWESFDDPEPGLYEVYKKYTDLNTPSGIGLLVSGGGHSLFVPIDKGSQLDLMDPLPKYVLIDQDSKGRFVSISPLSE